MKDKLKASVGPSPLCCAPVFLYFSFALFLFPYNILIVIIIIKLYTVWHYNLQMYLISLIKIYHIYYYINMHLVVAYSTYWVMKYCTLLKKYFIHGPLKDKFLASPLGLMLILIFASHSLQAWFNQARLLWGPNSCIILYFNLLSMVQSHVTYWEKLIKCGLEGIGRFFLDLLH